MSKQPDTTPQNVTQPSERTTHFKPTSPISVVASVAAQRASAKPASLTAADVLALQRTIGNRATANLLTPAPQSHPQPQEPPIQRKKDEAERGKKHRRMAHARKTIGLLGNNLKSNLDKHIFEALPADGSALDESDPVGLHAYNNGKLPKNIVRDNIEGTENQVHSITWHWKDKKDKTKWSTMFPIWMPVQHVRTLIALDFPAMRANAVDDTELSKEDTKAYIQRGHKFGIAKSGDTVYPVKEGE